MFKRFLEEFDLSLTILLTIFCMIFISIPTLNEIPMRIFLGLLFVLFLPGYSLIAMLFPRKDDLGGIERVALSFGLSIAVVPLIYLGLNYTQFGIKLEPLLIVMSIFTTSLSLIAWIRRLRLPTEERYRVSFERLFNVKKFWGGTVLNKGLSVILVISIIASSATVVYVVVKPKTSERFTEFYILGPNGTASDYPSDLKIGEEGKLIIGIVNHEYENVTYRLEVNFSGSLIHEEPIFLIENEKWESHFTFKVTKKGEDQKLEFLIYKDQQIEAYRILLLWISVI